ncbi:MAG TPA: helix-hairpin-helix domain-containing protein [Gemmatimonadaceae bacterium]|nr:helix-hairpin-helix domain-containing protein [Gemmatimonadaceae bacterium]
MPTPGEKKALLFLSSILLLGTGVRTVGALRDDQHVSPAAKAALESQIEAVDSARHRGKSKRSRKKKPATHIVEHAELEATPSIIDIDIASAAEIETLRGVGPSLAKRIVADRDSLGPFGSIDELTRVKGIGKKLSAKIAPQVTFSLLPRHPHTENDGTSSPPRSRRKSRRGESHI